MYTKLGEFTLYTHCMKQRNQPAMSKLGWTMLLTTVGLYKWVSMCPASLLRHKKKMVHQKCS